MCMYMCFFLFQAEDGIRYLYVTGVQTCALPISMWRMLQQARPVDYVIGTGETHSVRELCEVAFSHAGLDWKRYVKVNQRFVRPAEVDLLQADASKASRELGWTPRTSFADLVRMMVDADLERVA